MAPRDPEVSSHVSRCWRNGDSANRQSSDSQARWLSRDPWRLLESGDRHENCLGRRDSKWRPKKGVDSVRVLGFSSVVASCPDDHARPRYQRALHGDKGRANTFTEAGTRTSISWHGE